MKTSTQIKLALARIVALNPHLGDTQVSDMVYQAVFGAYDGSELAKRNYALCKAAA
jgi:hypothetical protein